MNKMNKLITFFEIIRQTKKQKKLKNKELRCPKS